MVGRRSFDAVTLTRLRAMPVGNAFCFLCIFFKRDSTYVPVKNALSQRWHVRTVRGEFEILATGVKWFDTRAQFGGGGAIDLAMHLLGLSFVDAVKYLVAKEGVHGPDYS
jgi:hypothetical protein